MTNFSNFFSEKKMLHQSFIQSRQHPNKNISRDNFLIYKLVLGFFYCVRNVGCMDI